MTPAPPTSPVSAAADYVSYSRIRLYQQCPLRFYFKYVAGLPEETVSASLVFGGAIHRAVEHHFRELLAGNGPPQLDILPDHYHQGWQERELQYMPAKDDERTQLDQLAERMLRTFQQSDLAVPRGRILAIEEELRGPLVAGLPDFLARVDLIVETPEELVISDCKTSRGRWSAEQLEESAPQLLLYCELVQEFAPGKPLRIEFAVLTKTKEVLAERHSRSANRRQIDRAKRIVERVWQAIEARHFYPAPSLTACPGCSYREPCRNWRG